MTAMIVPCVVEKGSAQKQGPSSTILSRISGYYADRWPAAVLSVLPGTLLLFVVPQQLGIFSSTQLVQLSRHPTHVRLRVCVFLIPSFTATAYNTEYSVVLMKIGSTKCGRQSRLCKRKKNENMRHLLLPGGGMC